VNLISAFAVPFKFIVKNVAVECPYGFFGFRLVRLEQNRFPTIIVVRMLPERNMSE